MSRTRVGAGAAPRPPRSLRRWRPQLRCPRWRLSPRGPRSAPAGAVRRNPAGKAAVLPAPRRDLEDGEVQAAGAEQGEVGHGTAPGAEEGTGGFIPLWGLYGKALMPEVMGEKLWSSWEEAADALEV